MKSLYRAVDIFGLAIILSMTCCAPVQGENRNLGSIDGIVIKEKQARIEGAEELEALELKMLQTKAAYARSEHKILETAFDRIVEEKMIRMEADKRGISEEELLDIEVRRKVQEPAAEEIDAVYEANKQRINAPREEVASQIIDYLKEKQTGGLKEEFLAGLKKNHEIVRSLGPLRFDVDASGRPSIGPSSAPVVLAVFSDFQCTYCKAFSQTLKQVVEKYGDKVRLVYRQYPLTEIHPDAQRAAEASLCAAAQNRFWEMHDSLFENPNELKDEDLKSKAEQIGLDSKAFQSCMASKRFSSQVREDMRAGATAGTEGTPTLFINGRYMHGNYPYEGIAEIIDEELKIKD
jgi:protein-disulfide isomerase